MHKELLSSKEEEGPLLHPEGYARKGTRDRRHVSAVENITGVMRAMPISFTIMEKVLGGRSHYVARCVQWSVW